MLFTVNSTLKPPIPPLLELPVAEFLPGEPVQHEFSTFRKAINLGLAVVVVSLLLVFSALFWPGFLLGAAIWGWPPNAPRLSQVFRYFRLIWTVKPPSPGLSVHRRIWITLAALRKCGVTPFWGLAWYLDEVLYGSQLRNTPVVAPLFEISASLSMAHQIRRKPALVRCAAVRRQVGPRNLGKPRARCEAVDASGQNSEGPGLNT